MATSGETPAGRVHLLKPRTHMNRSGRVLAGLRPAEAGGALPDLLVLVDDFALPRGTFRLRARGSAGGHNGLRSVEQAVQTREYARLRIGVGPLPAGLDGWADWVLEVMPREDRRLVEERFGAMGECVESWMTDGAEAAMARFNRRLTTDSDGDETE
jgi:PTH1 family peptidyl-tRNA hydrolase